MEFNDCEVNLQNQKNASTEMYIYLHSIPLYLLSLIFSKFIGEFVNLHEFEDIILAND